MRTRGRAAPRGRVRDFSGRFAWDILGILKIGGTPRADRDVRVKNTRDLQRFRTSVAPLGLSVDCR